MLEAVRLTSDPVVLSCRQNRPLVRTDRKNIEGKVIWHGKGSTDVKGVAMKLMSMKGKVLWDRR
jgi:hypothetical protein